MFQREAQIRMFKVKKLASNVSEARVMKPDFCVKTQSHKTELEVLIPH